MTTVTKNITHDQALAFFRYEDGLLYWNERTDIENFANNAGMKRWNTRFAGTIVGCVTNVMTKKRMVLGYLPKFYRRVNINKRTHFVHRLVYLFHHGVMPEQVDHIDGDSLNNRIENLRSSDYNCNMKNRRLSRRNKTGVTGLCYGRRDDGDFYRVSITANGVIYANNFKDFDDAVAWRQAKEIELFGEFRFAS